MHGRSCQAYTETMSLKRHYKLGKICRTCDLCDLKSELRRVSSLKLKSCHLKVLQMLYSYCIIVRYSHHLANDNCKVQHTVSLLPTTTAAKIEGRTLKIDLNLILRHRYR